MEHTPEDHAQEILHQRTADAKVVLAIGGTILIVSNAIAAWAGSQVFDDIVKKILQKNTVKPAVKAPQQPPK